MKTCDKCGKTLPVTTGSSVYVCPAGFGCNDTTQPMGYGSDPLGDGKFKMVPSGEIVDREERDRRLASRKARPVKNDCLGLSWEEIERMQGGKLKW